MANGYKSIYRLSRLSANLSREMAAEVLGISVDSIGDYEREETPAPCKIVVKMCDLYNDPKLAYMHLIDKCPIGRGFLPNGQKKKP